MTYGFQHPEELHKPKGGGAGCWLTAIFTGFSVMVLVLVGLFLPPFNLFDQLFSEQYTMLQAAGDAVTVPDQSFTFAAATGVDDEFGVRLGAVSLQDFESANEDIADWIPAAKNAVPYYLALQSPVYTLRTKGTAPQAVQISMAIPPAASPDLLDIYGWFTDETGTRGRWEFMAASVNGNRLQTITQQIPERVAIFQAAPDAPQVFVSYDVDRVLSDEVAQIATIVSPAGLQPTLDGSVTGSLAPGFDLNAEYQVMPVVRDFSDPRALDTETVETIIGNSQLRAEHIQQLTLLTSGGGFDGIFIDYRGLAPEQREHFTRFIQELKISLNSVGRQLGIVVPAAENIDGVWQTGAYDWRALGAEVDFIKIDLSLNPLTFTPDNQQLVESMLRWATGELDRYKILLGLSAQSAREIAGTFTPIGYDEALAGLGNVQVESDHMTESGIIEPGSVIRARLDGREAAAGVNTAINAPYLDYLDAEGNITARMWLTTSDALRFRMDWTVPFALGGVGFHDLLEEDIAGDVLQAIGSFRTQIPSAPAPTNLALSWRVEGGDGTVIEEIKTGINEDLVLTLEAPDGNYAINVAVVGTGQEAASESVRTGASVALFSPTTTPTPPPTPTPTPLPTNTPTPAPVVPTVEAVAQLGAPSGGGVNANPLSAGRIATGPFEYGGHVTSAGSSVAINAMQRAGMTWMKVQIRYGPGASPDVAAGAIQGAKAAGFKILIGTVGNPADLAAGGDAYIQGYANWLGGIAALGADAIEVWNEPNLDREWPRGQISGAAYTNMLRQAFQAINSANGNTIVISGALAPTGAEGAFPGQVVNDDNFLRQMIDAGALQWADCIGMHYNEGIVPPTAVSGDPRGDYYTRYFQSMLDVYSGITGGQRPLCITELGYLTPEGYPPLPEFFSWAQNVTVAQQAAWLAQAAALSSQSGRVRMMIVWNVDFTLYANDPQGGYAMIRPDGSCPACDALAGAR